MSAKKEEKIDLNNIPEEEKVKYEIAEELGLLDKVLDSGWKSPSLSPMPFPSVKFRDLLLWVCALCPCGDEQSGRPFSS